MRIALAICLGLAASCSKFETSGNLPPPKRKVLNIPMWTLKAELPSSAWLAELSAPSLANLKQISVDCRKDARVIQVSWKLQKTSCEWLQQKYPKKEILCLDAGSFTAPVSSCSDRGKLAFLESIQFSSKDALYEKSTEHRYNPNVDYLQAPFHFPEIIFSDSQKQLGDLEAPLLEEWLAGASEEGALILALELENNAEANSWASFHRFLLTQDRPNLMPLGDSFRNPNRAGLFSASKGRLKLPYPQVSSAYKDPLHRSLCNYIDQWLKSRFLLSRANPDKAKPLAMKCKVYWQHALPVGAIELTRLPIPLISVRNRSFPFATKSSTLSVDVFNSIGHTPGN